MRTAEAVSPMDVPDTIICVDCGQKAHRLTLPPENGWEPGDIVAYRCAGCNDRWDLVVEDPDRPDRPAHGIDLQNFLNERRKS